MLVLRDFTITHSPFDAAKMEDAGAQYAKMKVADLKKELKTRGLAVTGNKNELVERLLAAEGHAPLASVEGNEEEFDEEEILGGDMDSAEIGKITPQEEEAALKGITLKKTSALKTPAKKTNLKRETPTPAAKAAKSPVKRAAVATNTASKEQENIEPAEKTAKLEEDEGEKSALEKRAERFGIPMTETAKKEARANRFGGLTNGAVKGSNKLSKEIGVVDVDKLKKRAERFGVVTSKSLTKVEETEKKKTRLERFGDEKKSAKNPEEEAKVDAAKSARAARFAADATAAKTKPEEKVAE